jgi:hypothetical protein
MYESEKGVSDEASLYKRIHTKPQSSFDRLSCEEGTGSHRAGLFGESPISVKKETTCSSNYADSRRRFRRPASAGPMGLNLESSYQMENKEQQQPTTSWFGL